jgi:hypothetical protein
MHTIRISILADTASALQARISFSGDPQRAIGVPRGKKMKKQDPVDGRWLTVEEMRLVADLRIMHSKVDELFEVVTELRRRHDEVSIRIFADRPVLERDISRVDEMYLWFISLKDETYSKKFG